MGTGYTSTFIKVKAGKWNVNNHGNGYFEEGKGG